MLSNKSKNKIVYTNPHGLGLGDGEPLSSLDFQSSDLNHESVPFISELTQEAKNKTKEYLVSLRVNLKILFCSDNLLKRLWIVLNAFSIFELREDSIIQ